MHTDQQGSDLLGGNVVRATAGKRLANYIIDLVMFYLLAFLVGIGIALVHPEVFEGMDDDSFNLGAQLLTLMCYALYMAVVEAIFKGKTLGKLITGTRAVNLDGSKISTKTAFTRGLCRAVPFCAFSALGSPCDPWQDRWTDTMVMDEKQSIIGL